MIGLPGAELDLSVLKVAFVITVADTVDDVATGRTSIEPEVLGRPVGPVKLNQIF